MCTGGMMCMHASLHAGFLYMHASFLCIHAGFLCMHACMLVSCTYFGQAHVCGCIDIHIIHGRLKAEAGSVQIVCQLHARVAAGRDALDAGRSPERG